MPAHVCLVCDYPHLSEPPRSEFGGGSFEICPCCGFQFGVNDDGEGISYDDWRRKWENGGMKWASFDIKPPRDWKPVAKFAAASGPGKKRRTTEMRRSG
jgi:hypothetical protein